MTDRFGLGPSQLESLHALLRLPEGKLLALNGPPGTGKTAWIQSAVASLWVEKALAGDKPPIIVATSANNRAVTNILDTFQKAAATSTNSALSKRWLPKIDTFGLFLPAAGQSQKTNHRWATPGTPEWEGLPKLMEERPYLEESEAHYLERASFYFGRPVTGIETVTEHLLGRLREVNEQVGALHARGDELLALRASMPDSSPESAREKLFEERAAAEAAIDRVEALAQGIDEATAVIPFWEELFSFLPPIRDRRNQRLVRLFKRAQLEAPDLTGWSYRQGLESKVEEHRRRAATRLSEIEARRQEIETWAGHETNWRAELESLVAELSGDDRARAKGVAADSIADPLKVGPLTDQTLRRRLFLLAGRYWEG
ncbi:MAG: hypothetical protein AAF725_28015, partial [Acidobacteriota bacterium]